MNAITDIKNYSQTKSIRESTITPIKGYSNSNIGIVLTDNKSSHREILLHPVENVNQN